MGVKSGIDRETFGVKGDGIFRGRGRGRGTLS